MAKIDEQLPEALPEGATWEVELRKVGFVRRLFMARRWYGADWWFVAISAVGVFAFIIIAFFPGLFAPFSPDALVGPSFLAPGAHVDLPVLVVPATSPVHTLQDLAVPAGADRSTVAVIEGAPTGGALNEQSQKIDQVIKNQPGGLRLRPIIDRYPTLEGTLQAVVNGIDKSAVVQTTQFNAIKAQFPTLRVAASITGVTSTAGGFMLGTNDIGQDVLSRLLWGTRIALIIGFSSSIVSLIIGVPLGLLAGFVGGTFDRLLSLLMDSLYAFPGLILAIAITAVLGPSIFNIIIARTSSMIGTRITKEHSYLLQDCSGADSLRKRGSLH